MALIPFTARLSVKIFHFREIKLKPNSGERLGTEQFVSGESGLLCQARTEMRDYCLVSSSPLLSSLAYFLSEQKGFSPSGTPCILDRESCLAFILARVSDGISHL